MATSPLNRTNHRGGNLLRTAAARRERREAARWGGREGRRGATRPVAERRRVGELSVVFFSFFIQKNFYSRFFILVVKNFLNVFCKTLSFKFFSSFFPISPNFFLKKIYVSQKFSSKVFLSLQKNSLEKFFDLFISKRQKNY